MTRQFHNPPGWPVAPTSWVPAPTWRPAPAWPPPPPGWVFWTDTSLWPDPVAADVAPAPRTSSHWLVRLAWLPTLALGVAAYFVVLNTMIETRNPNLFPTLLFIGAFTVPTSVLLLAHGVGRRVGDSGALLATAAFGGGIIGVITASQLEYSTLKSMPSLGMVAVAVIEEAAKMIVPIAIFIFARRRTQGRGVDIGIAAGAGFAVLETMGYGFTALLASNGDLAAVDQTLLIRALLSPAGHVAWTGMVCAALWRTTDPGRRWKIPVLVGAFLLAVALHATWDNADTTPVYVAVAVVSLLLLILSVIATTWRRPAPRRQRTGVPFDGVASGSASH